MKKGNEWASISDLMSGLMMVFLFIAIVFMLNTEKKKNDLREIALTYQRSQTNLNKKLRAEFENDLDKWGAEILADNTVRFKEPDVLFDKSSASIKVEFKKILEDFFPRYIAVLTSARFKKDIDEVRIEGHTSSKWREGSSKIESYLGNAKLSQKRAYSVLNYCYKLPQIKTHLTWLSKTIRANGLSFAKIIKDDNGQEDRARSRRVEFRVITKTEEKIFKIIQESGG